MLSRFANVVFWTCASITALATLLGLAAIFNGGDKFVGAMALIAAFLFFMLGLAFRYVVVGPKPNHRVRSKSNENALSSVSQPTAKSTTVIEATSEEYTVREAVKLTAPPVTLPPEWRLTDLNAAPIIRRASRDMENDGFLTRLWQGRIPLWITYWIFGVLGSLILRFATPLLTFLLIKNAERISEFYRLSINYSWLIFCTAYSVFIMVCIWKSAKSYSIEKPRKARRGGLARASVILSGIALCGNLAQALTVNEADTILRPVSADDRLSSQAAIAGMNANLPKRIDAVSTLERISIVNQILTYSISIDNPVPDQNAFKNSMASILLQKCSEKPFADFVNEMGVLRYVYSDPVAGDFASILIRKSDCHR